MRCGPMCMFTDISMRTTTAMPTTLSRLREIAGCLQRRITIRMLSTSRLQRNRRRGVRGLCQSMRLWGTGSLAPCRQPFLHGRGYAAAIRRIVTRPCQSTFLLPLFGFSGHRRDHWSRGRIHFEFRLVRQFNCLRPVFGLFSIEPSAPSTHPKTRWRYLLRGPCCTLDIR